jgi:hypothetical protein
MRKQRQAEDLLGTYVRLATDHGEASEASDWRKANRINAKLIEVFKQLVRMQRRDELKTLLEHEQPAVRLFAAIHTLTIAEADALRVLDELSRGMGSIAFHALIYSRGWREGSFPPIEGDPARGRHKAVEADGRPRTAARRLTAKRWAD